MVHDLIFLILGMVLILSSLGVILAKKPVHSGLFFLLTLLTLAVIYMQLSSQFIAVMQILVYAGAILVIFMFVIILFQDAHRQIALYHAKTTPGLLFAAGSALLLAFLFFGSRIIDLPKVNTNVPAGFGNVEAIGYALYIDFFFPFEAVILIFLIAVVGAVYIGKKVR